MIESIVINPPEKIQGYTELTVREHPVLEGFPLLSIDRDSYIVQAELHSGINLRPEGRWHYVAIGKGCALADGVSLMIDQNHDYKAVSQEDDLYFLKDVARERRLPRKSAIIMQNDVWVGSCATIMSGVTLRNGCVVAAKAVVTKDVPPYAIVGGNPAQILGYRFDEKTIAGLQKIAFWDWPEEVKLARKADFALPANEFVEKHIAEAEANDIPSQEKGSRKVVLFPVDLGSRFAQYPRILETFFEKDRPNLELVIYLPEEMSREENVCEIEHILEKYQDRNSFVTLQAGMTLDERFLFQGADFYVATRGEKTVYRTCLADRYGVKILYGTDYPAFPPELY